MNTYLVMTPVAAVVSLAVLVYLGRRISLSDGAATEGLCRLDHDAPANVARCAECGP